MVPLLSSFKSSAHFSTACPIGSSVVFSKPMLIVTTSPDAAAAVVSSAFVSSAAFVSAGAAVVLVDALLPHALSTMDAHITADTAAIALFFISFFLP